jgi:hypothetical protein
MALSMARACSSVIAGSRPASKSPSEIHGRV